MPENPKALSPWIQITLSFSLAGLSRATKAAAIANPLPTPIVANVPASNLKINYKNYLMIIGITCALAIC